MRSDRLEFIADRLASNLDASAMVRELADALVSEAGVAACRVWLRGRGDQCDSCDQASQCSDRRECLHLAAGSNLDPALHVGPERYPINAVPVGLVVRTGATLVSNDLAGDARFPDKHWIAQAGLKSCVALPLGRPDETTGIVAMFCREELTDRNIHEASRFVCRAAMLLAGARQVDALREQVRHLHRENFCLREEILSALPFEQMVGTSPAIRKLRERIEAAAAHASPVLIVGPAGSGKELVARTLHACSLRAPYPLLKIPCGELGETAMESELFGHEEGAFSSAAEGRIGRLELAASGSLFFHRIERMPLSVQDKLCCVIECGRFHRIGGKEPLTAHARFIASTIRELAAAVDSGQFHGGLYAAFGKCVLTVPGLKDRSEDIPLLVEHALRRFCRRYQKEISQVAPSTMADLTRYAWPGNLRELCQVIEHAVLTCTGHTLTAEWGSPPVATSEPPATGGEALADVERAHIIRVLRRTGGVVQGPGGAARILGLHPSTLRSRMAKLGIPRRI